MPNDVVVRFVLNGIPDISRGLRTVQQSAEQSDRQRVAAAQRAAQQRTRVEEQEAKAKIRAILKSDADVKRIHERAVKDAERAAKARARAELAADKEVSRAAERSAQERIRISRQVDREMAQISKRRERENERMLREGRRLEEQTHREQTRRMQREENQRQSSRQQFARGMGSQIASGIGRGVSRVGGAMMQTAGLVTQLGGGFGISDSVQRAAKNSGQLEDILNSAANPASRISANKVRRSAADVEGDIQGSAIRFGMDREEIQKGLGDITGITGDFETAMKLLPQLAELSRATGSKFDDMAQAAGNVGLSFDDMTDSGQKAEQVMKVMRVLAGQGKAGNVEIRDQAVQAAKVIASAGKFEGDNAENIAKMGAIMQFSRGGGGAWNAASAATAVTAFSSTFGKGARLDAFDAAGINVFADKDKTKIRPPEQIIAEAIDKTKGSAPEMNALFGSVMSGRATNKFVDIYSRAEKEKKGTGKAKILSEFSAMAGGMAMTKGDVREAANRRTAALDVRMAAVREEFDKAVQDRIIPALLKLVPEIEKLIPVFVDLNAKAIPAFVDLLKTVADFADKNKGLIADIASHPVGALIAVEITKSFAAAGIGELIKRLLGGGSGGASGGPGGVAAPAVGTALGAAFVTTKAMMSYGAGTDEAQDISAKVRAFQRTGGAEGMSPQDAQREIADAQRRLSKGNMFSRAADLATSPFVEGSDKDYKQYKRDQGLVDNKELTELISALKDNTAATKANNGTGGQPGANRPAAATTGIAQRASGQ